ncbi:phosphotransferase enzyme family protein [Actinopolymorpha rutila]|uniref:Ser/Thr protein kinase RdoA (MazF antagonist) n=1 Tax=Actinopolymorpha rutila TaxID=446787 RepID=A0A852ZNV1_9ACTN|nr:phosphotransferase [Actinopolymorpha rutila]NYH93578.1 Ser/Thr protein kinase RdoA (MazF antagonist) [Actinopolymorpha rutila]
MTRIRQPEELAGMALLAYDLAPDTRLSLLASGLTTAFQVVTADRRYVLRVHRRGYRTAANTRAELNYLRDLGEALVGADVDSPRPVSTRDGDLVVEVSDDQHCDLITWVDGEVRRPENGLDVGAVRQLGRALALIHNASDGITAPSDLPRWDADGMFTTAGSPFRPLMDIDDLLSTADRADFDDIAGRTREIFAELSTEFGVIHFDYILGNVHLSRNGNEWQVGVFDFEDCGLGHYLYDLCPMLGNLAGYPAGTYNPDYPVLRDTFLDGYRSARPLPVEWERHLPVLMAARHANHCFLTAGLNVSPTPREDAAWRMDLARLSLELPV